MPVLAIHCFNSLINGWNREKKRKWVNEVNDKKCLSWSVFQLKALPFQLPLSSVNWQVIANFN